MSRNTARARADPVVVVRVAASVPPGPACDPLGLAAPVGVAVTVTVGSGEGGGLVVGSPLGSPCWAVTDADGVPCREELEEPLPGVVGVVAGVPVPAGLVVEESGLGVVLPGETDGPVAPRTEIGQMVVVGGQRTEVAVPQAGETLAAQRVAGEINKGPTRLAWVVELGKQA